MFRFKMMANGTRDDQVMVLGGQGDQSLMMMSGLYISLDVLPS